MIKMATTEATVNFKIADRKAKYKLLLQEEGRKHQFSMIG